MRHDLVGARLEQLQHASSDIGRRRGLPAQRSRLPAPACGGAALRRRRLGRLDIGLDDAAMRAGAGNGREIDAGFLGDTTRQRRGEDALAVTPATGAGVAQTRLAALLRLRRLAALAPRPSALGLGRRRRPWRRGLRALGAGVGMP